VGSQQAQPAKFPKTSGKTSVKVLCFGWWAGGQRGTRHFLPPKYIKITDRQQIEIIDSLVEHLARSRLAAAFKLCNYDLSLMT